MTGGYISADSHVTEPIELYADRVDNEFKSRVPRIVDVNGWRTVEAEGLAPRRLMSVDQLQVATVGAPDPEQREREQRDDGVIAEVVYPTWALNAAFVGEPALQLALSRAYNDWAVEHLTSAHRSLPVAMIPMGDVPSAVIEAQRVAALGLRALSLPCRLQGREYNDPVFEPFWDAASELGLPLTFHSGTGYEPRLMHGQGANVMNYVLGAQFDGPRVLLSLAAGGVLDRHQDLHVVATETGASWLGWVMTQADGVYVDHAMFSKTKLSDKPSEFIRRQCHATFMLDPVAIKNRDVTGLDCLIWGNDYPHPEGTWPKSQTDAVGQLEGVSEADQSAIMGGTAARVFGFEQALL
jgi:predicted TIM-barrel fold metal-dependent hydrolase